jgi:ParB/RepB/Spo0J family partition protein
MSKASYLRHISPDQIERNEDNPRLFFRTDELATLMASIKRYGVQVPITVYEKGDSYVLIDGERRWRCASKLNLKAIPAIVQPEPSALDNLLLMFNIHALREQWDYLTIANKLPQVIERFAEEHHGREPNEIELSELTGLSRGQIRRCHYLLGLPERYKQILLQELALPKAKQQLSEDFFIEMERALRTVEIRVPSAIGDFDVARDALITKFRKNVIGNITDFRKLSKIATSIQNVGVRQQEATKAIREILSPANNVSIQGVFAEHFEIRYDARKLTLHLRSIADFLEPIASNGNAPPTGELLEQMRKVYVLLGKVLKKSDEH